MWQRQAIFGHLRSCSFIPKTHFFYAVRSFYQAAFVYRVKWLPLDDPLFKGSKFIDISSRALSNFHELTDLILKFSSRFDKFINNPAQLDLLEEKF